MTVTVRRTGSPPASSSSGQAIAPLDDQARAGSWPCSRALRSNQTTTARASAASSIAGVATLVKCVGMNCVVARPAANSGWLRQSIRNARLVAMPSATVSLERLDQPAAGRLARGAMGDDLGQQRIVVGA